MKKIISGLLLISSASVFALPSYKCINEKKELDLSIEFFNLDKDAVVSFVLMGEEKTFKGKVGTNFRRDNPKLKKIYIINRTNEVNLSIYSKNKVSGKLFYKGGEYPLKCKEI